LDKKDTPYGNITLKTLTKAVNHIFSKPPPKKHFVFLRGCKTKRMVSTFDHCGDSSCNSCNYFNKALKNAK